MVFLKAIVVWLVFIVAESINGTVRMFWLVPLLGDVRAHQISFMMGALLILAIATISIKWIHASRTSQLIKVGLLWLLLTVVFEIVLGRFILGYSWQRIAADYNLLQGGLMPIGLVFLVLSPIIATRLRNFIDSTYGNVSVNIKSGNYL
jgi:Na+/melibiose symporter-like transporter